MSGIGLKGAPQPESPGWACQADINADLTGAMSRHIVARKLPGQVSGREYYY
jgi:hypothetical protein